jgi:hypothetical protein
VERREERTELDLVLNLSLDRTLAINLERVLASLLARTDPRLRPLVGSLGDQVGDTEVGHSKRTIFGEVLVIHDLDDERFLLAVHFDVDDPIGGDKGELGSTRRRKRGKEPTRPRWDRGRCRCCKEKKSQLLSISSQKERAGSLHLSPSDGNSAVQHPRVRVRLAAGERLDVLEVLGSLEENPDDSDGRREAASAVDGAGHQDGLPLSGQADTTRFGVTEGEPVLSLVVGFEDIVELDVDVAELGIGDDGVVVEDRDANDGAGFVGDEELGGALPDGVGSALESLRLVDLLAVEGNRDEWVDLLAARVEFLGLVDDEADDSGLCGRCKRVSTQAAAEK